MICYCIFLISFNLLCLIVFTVLNLKLLTSVVLISTILNFKFLTFFILIFTVLNSQFFTFVIYASKVDRLSTRHDFSICSNESIQPQRHSDLIKNLKHENIFHDDEAHDITSTIYSDYIKISKQRIKFYLSSDLFYHVFHAIYQTIFFLCARSWEQDLFLFAKSNCYETKSKIKLKVDVTRIYSSRKFFLSFFLYLVSS